MVARTRLIVTLYVHCLSCLIMMCIPETLPGGVKEPKHETTRFNILPKLKNVWKITSTPSTDRIWEK